MHARQVRVARQQFAEAGLSIASRVLNQAISGPRPPPIGAAARGVVTAGSGMLSALQARETTQKDIWIMGGAATLQSALEEGLVDLVELFLVPVLLGSGLTLLNDFFPRRRPVAGVRRHRGLPRRGREAALHRAEGRQSASACLSFGAEGHGLTPRWRRKPVRLFVPLS